MHFSDRAEVREESLNPLEFLPKFVSDKRWEELQGKNTICVPYLDLHVVFYLPLPCLSNRERSASVLLTEGLLYRNGLTQDEVFSSALKNLSSQTVVEPFGDVLTSLPIAASLPAMELSDTLDIPVYYVSNLARNNGAAAILCESVRSELTDLLGDPFLILPSSVHEILCLPVDPGHPVEDWSDIVREINEACVDPTEQLSDHVYLCGANGILVSQNLTHAGDLPEESHHDGR
ncbi:MAG: hypothetical protein IK096_02300 [Lachnospiraceae bacterium]|nr:hypothetical protein [Lachnospiraceae bacterium]